MDPESKFTLSEGVLFEDVDGDTVVLHPSEDTYFEINDVGAVVLSAVRDGLALEQIIVRITDHYDVAASEASNDATAFLTELLEADLVRRA